jgi:hypothetical protein
VKELQFDRKKFQIWGYGLNIAETLKDTIEVHNIGANRVRGKTAAHLLLPLSGDKRDHGFLPDH